MATMVVWALNVSAVRWLTGVMDNMLVICLRMICGCLVLVFLLFLGRQHLPRWRGRTLMLAVASALFMVYGNQMLFVGAMARTTASNAVLILALNPMLNGVLEALVFRKRLTVSYLAGGGVALVGVCMVILNRPQTILAGPSLGDLLVVASMLSFSAGVLIFQRLTRDHNAQATNVFLYLIGTSALVLHGAVLLESPLAAIHALSWQEWAVVVFSGALATAAGAVAWTRGIAILGLGRAAVYMAWVPVLGVGFGALLLGEKLTIWHLAGMILVLLGTVMSSQRFRCFAAASA